MADTGKRLADVAELFGWAPYLLDERDKLETTTFLDNTRHRTAFVPAEEDEVWLPSQEPQTSGDLLFYEGYCEDPDALEPAREFAARYVSLLRVQKERRRAWEEYRSPSSGNTLATIRPLTSDISASHVETVEKDYADSSVALTSRTIVPGMSFGVDHDPIGKLQPSITLGEFLDGRISIISVLEADHPAWSVVSSW